MRAAAAMRFTCSGVVPQQPPTSLHAELEHAPRVDAEVLGRRHVDHALVDPPREAGVRRPPRRGSPSGSIFSTAASTFIGPSEQLTPTTLAPHSRIRRATSSALGAVGHAAGSSSDADRDDGHLAACAAADRGFDGDAQLGRLAHRLDDERVDAGLDERRAPAPRTPPCTLREIAPAARASPRKYPLGPIAPTTYACPAAASRATRTPAAFSSRTRTAARTSRGAWRWRRRCSSR